MLGGTRKVIRIAGVAAAVILLALIGMTAYVDDLLNNINRVSYEDTIASGIEEAGEALGADVEAGTVPEADAELDSNAVSDKDADTKETDTMESALEATQSGTVNTKEPAWDGETEVTTDKKVKNILLIGQDRREDEDEQQRSDSMIICSVNMKTDKITLVSLMRDMYVPIPGYQSNRINASYAIGGMKLLDETIEKNFGIHIDGNVEVDFEGFIDSMSEVGELEMELTQEEADYINERTVPGAGRELKEGVNALSARQTLHYARMRYVGNGDYERTERQRKVLIAAFDKMKASGLGTTIRTARHVLPNFTTDMSNKEIFGYVFKVKTGSMSIASETYRLPVDGAYSAERINEMEVLVPDIEKNRDELKRYLYGIKPGKDGKTQEK